MQKLTVLIISMSLLKSASLIGITLTMLIVSTGLGFAAKLAEGQEPTEFYPASAFLDAAEMQEILAPGTVWCMDPQGDSCLFLSVLLTVDGDKYFYDVFEKWDESTVLSVPVSSTLKSDGTLCETATGTFDEIVVTTENGKKVKPGFADEIRGELEASWENYIGVEYCYSYVITDPREPDVITQFVHEDGVLMDIRFSFFTDTASGAASYYTLRDI